MVQIYIACIVFTLCVSFADGFFRSDHYSVLGVDRNAAHREIAAAFRKLSLMFHPDKNPEHRYEAEAKFARLSEAYTVLSNAEKRRLYDRVQPIRLHFASRESFENAAPGNNGETHWFNFEDGNKPVLSSRQGDSWYYDGGQSSLDGYGSSSSEYGGSTRYGSSAHGRSGGTGNLNPGQSNLFPYGSWTGWSSSAGYGSAHGNSAAFGDTPYRMYKEMR